MPDVRRIVLPTILSILTLAACSQPAQTPPQSPPAAADKHGAHDPGEPAIAWFDGNIAEAFALAREDDTPIFLYWGAVWCPPCNIIKSTVFNDPEFVAQTRHFIPVYMDGDSEGAQRWGEHYGTVGYPTLIVFGPDGQELTRLSAGMQVQRYRDVLARVLAGQQSVKALLDRALNSTDELSAAQWEALAWHSWAVDQQRTLTDADKPSAFARLARRCPSPVLARRFALLAMIERPDDADPDPNDVDLLTSILGSEDEVRANFEELIYAGVELIDRATAADADARRGLHADYRKAIGTAWTDAELPLALRLDSLYGLIALDRSGGGSVSAELRDRVRARVAQIRQQPLTPQELQSLAPSAANLLHEIGDAQAARQLLLDEMQSSIAPYYFMSYLAAFEREAGHPEQALEWSRKAWNAAQGPATRTQWGLSHLKRVLELGFDDTDEVVTVLTGVFETLAEHPGAFYQRSRMRLQRQLPELRAWAADDDERAAALQAAEPAVRRACAGTVEGTPSARLCQDYLALVGGPPAT